MTEVVVVEVVVVVAAALLPEVEAEVVEAMADEV